MSDLNDLQLLDDPVEVAEDLPEQRQGRVPLLQPSIGIILQLPGRFDYQTIQTDAGQRLMVKFYETPLRTFPGGVPLPASVSNLPQDRKGPDGQKVTVNQWIYLLRALGYTGTPKTNREYANALSDYAEDFFKADWDWSGNCNPKKDAYVEGKGRVGGRSGCGQKYSLRARTYNDRDGKSVTVLAIPRNPDGTYQESLKCKCGATVFMNGELSNFQPAPRAQEASA